MILLTELWIFCAPFFEVAAIIFVMAGLAIYFLRAQFTKWWLRICARIAGAAVAIPLFFVIVFFLLMANCSSRPTVFVSPDSRHVADYSHFNGFLGRDSTSVTIRKSWSVAPEEVYEFSGPSDWPDTKIRWMNNERLQIEYPAWDIRQGQCKHEAAGVQVECIWGSDPPKTQRK